MFSALKISYGTYDLVNIWNTGNSCTDRKKSVKIERRWTIIALRNLIFYFWSNIELTWHECSFMSQITTYEEKMF